MSDDTIPPPLPPEALAGLSASWCERADRTWDLRRLDKDPKSCTRLMRPLSSTETLPDHVCELNKKMSVYYWQVDDMAAHVDARWPLPHRGRLLMLVVRQWATQGTTWLPNWLAKDARGQQAVKYMRLALAWYEAISNLAIPLEVARERDGDILAASQEAAFDLRSLMDGPLMRASLLQRLGLPHTPEAATHLWNMARGTTDADDVSKGALVTTFIYGIPPPAPDAPEASIELGFANATAEVVITAPMTILTKSLIQAAGDIASAHRAWLAAFYPSTSWSRPEIASSLPTDYREQGELDYVKETLSDVTVRDVLIQLDNKVRLKDAIGNGVNRAFDRVGQRRRVLEMPTKPPKGARAVARKQLERVVKARWMPP